MDDERAPVSVSAKQELDRMMSGGQRYRFIKAARRWLSILAVVVAVVGLLELFLAPFEPGSRSAVYEKLTALQIFGRLFEVAGRVFVLLVAAQVLQLWLDVSDELQSVRELLRTRR